MKYNILSSGYNDPPFKWGDCKKNLGKCYKNEKRKKFFDSLGELINDKTLYNNVVKLHKSEFKSLDYCMAIHAEERAIINLAKYTNLKGITTTKLFTTLFPCNLCAKKIAELEIDEVVFFEPYPMKEAKDILTKAGVTQTSFDGITYNGYFRFKNIDILQKHQKQN